jgi:hypothetical protein
MLPLTEAAERAFVHGYATVDMYKILVEQVLDPASPEYKGPLNTWSHSRRLADPSDRAIVALNVDTPYSYCWLDLRAEPVVITLPAFDAGRYMSAMLVDLYTYILGYVSPRTNGTAGGAFLVAGPEWSGTTPAGVTGVFRSNTTLALVLLRTQLFGDADMPIVAALQDRCRVETLSAWLGAPGAAPLPMPAPIPTVDVRAAPTPAFFDVLAWMLAFMPPIPGDEAPRSALREVGVEAGQPVEPGDAARRGAILAGMGQGLAAMAAFARSVTSSGQLFGSREFFAGDDTPRAVGAMLGILGNAAEEYLGIGWQADELGRPFTGERSYTIRFGPQGLPPVDAFWSITLYDAERFLYANPVNRYVVNSRGLAALVRDADGGVTIHVQHEAPAPARLPNWLPCPTGPFGLTFRTYLPRLEIRSGEWTAPPVRPHQPHEETP